MDETELIPLKDVPKLLKVSKVTLWKWIKDGRIATVRLSERKIYIRKEEIERFIRANEGVSLSNITRGIILPSSDG